MTPPFALAALASISVVLATTLLTWIMIRVALRHGFIDKPNERSSHVRPTPRGGGVAIVLVTTLALVLLYFLGRISLTTFAVLSVGGLAVAVVGFIDDRRPLSTRVRLAVHFGAAFWAMFLMDGLPPMQLGDYTISFGWAGYGLGVVGIVWMLNLFNFMDGIDGIAASEAAFVSIAGTAVLAIGNLDSGVGAIGITLGAACFGFLVWNWPPAKIFLGDVGSGYLGYFLACMALTAARENPVALFVFLILGAVFVVDATVTFLRRIARRERYDVAHRTHGYQRLARRWGSHGRVTVTIWIANLAVMLPAACLAAHRPSWAGFIAVGISMAVLGVALAIGAGRAEPPPPA